MDSGWIVAGTSISTIIATGLFSIWSKRIDAKQKVNEHRLSVRSIFLVKKIEAGQQFIGRMNIIRNSIAVELHLLDDLKYGRGTEEKILLESNALIEKISSLPLSLDDSTDAFFNLSESFNEFNLLLYNITKSRKEAAHFTKEMNTSQPKRHLQLKTELPKLIEQQISICNEMLSICRNMSNDVRTELAKYDTL
jgi:hypothetical protein